MTKLKVYRVSNPKGKVYRSTQRDPRLQYGKLVWEVNGRKVTIAENQTWDALMKLKRELKDSPQYRERELKLRYMFN